MKRATTVAIISEHTQPSPASQRDGAISMAELMGLKLVANIGMKTTCASATCVGAKPSRDALTKLILNVTDGNPVTANLEFNGASWQELTDPFVELVRALDVDIVIGATFYASCVALIKSCRDLKHFPRSLGISQCIGDSNLYNDVGKDLRWISGPSQVCRRTTWTYSIAALSVSSHSDVEITYVQARAPARTHTHSLSLTHTKTHICHEHTSGKERSQARTIPKPRSCP